MKKIIFTLLAMSILVGASAQNKKCGIDTKALVAEEIASGATHINMLAKMAPNFDRGVFEKAGIVFGAQAGQIITLRVPVESLPLLESSKEVLEYSISHRIAAPECNNTRFDTRTDSVQAGLGLDIADTAFTGENVYIGITDWGFDYTHPNYNNGEGNYRLEMAWDHFRLAGPAPEGYDYGTLISGRDNLLAARGDTSNLYGYGTHGTHVAGICAGRGARGNHRGQAPNAKLLFCSFELGEKEWMDAVGWMRQVAQDSARRLVVNSSWGMYSFSTLDGTSLLSEAINTWSDEGTIFCTSGGNNGRTQIPFHISRNFNEEADTLRTVAIRASQIYSISETGQALIMWGEAGHDFAAGVRIWKSNSVHWRSPMYNTADGDTVIYDTVYCGTTKVGYRILIEHSNLRDNRPHIQMDVDRVDGMETQLYIIAGSGTVHAWNIANKRNHAGNEGCSFERRHSGFTAGDARYGVGEPACAAKCISVAAHTADRKDRELYIAGDIADFSSAGPLINGVMKPEISAPGVDVISSISAWQQGGSYAAKDTMTVEGQRYIWSEMSGTSMSSPAVTGAVALLLEANPAITIDQLRHSIFSTARNDSITGPIIATGAMDPHWGWGKIDTRKAVNEAIRPVGINQVETLRPKLRIFPNPATGSVRVMTLCGERQMLEIYTVEGRLVMQTPVEAETTLDLSGWKGGLYILRVGSRSEKLIVK